MLRAGFRTALHASRTVVQPTFVQQKTPSLVLTFSTSRFHARQEERTIAFNAVNKIPKVWLKEVVVNDLVKIFRTLEAYMHLESVEKGTRNKNAPAISDYKFAWRTLFTLIPSSGTAAEQAAHKVKLSDVRDKIPAENGRAWDTIHQHVRKGTITKLDEMSPKMKAMIEFSRLHGVGGKKAERLYEQGFRSIKEAMQGAKMEKAQHLIVDHLDDVEKLIPRSESEAYCKQLNAALAECGDEFDFQGEILGSFVRKEAWSSDIDYIVHTKAYQELDPDYGEELVKILSDKLIEKGILFEQALATGYEKWIGLAKLPGYNTVRRIDIRCMPMRTYASAKLRSTGDLEFLKVIQDIAKAWGLLLNEHGLGKRLLGEDRNMAKGSDTHDPDFMIDVQSEEEIFEKLKIDFVPPEKRNYNTAKAMMKQFQSTYGIKALTKGYDWSAEKK